MEERYEELTEETIEIFKGIVSEKSFPLDIGFQFIGDVKSKNLIKLSKLPEDLKFILSKDIKVIINEEMMSAYDDESIKILFEQEIEKIEYNIDSGKIKLAKTDLNTFASIVNKHGVEKVARANQVEELYEQQKKDGKDTGDGFLV